MNTTKCAHTAPRTPVGLRRRPTIRMSRATLSPCEQYRYQLVRAWDWHKPLLSWILLNPSVADAGIDDATVRRLIGFADDHGFGGIVVRNVFAWRATDPTKLVNAADPVGPDNARYVQAAAWHEVTVLGWGAHGDRYPHQVARTMATVVHACRRRGTQLAVLDWTASGQPKHPLRLPAATQLDIVDPGAPRESMDARWGTLLSLADQMPDLASVPCPALKAAA